MRNRTRLRSAFLRDLADGVGQSSGNPNPNVSAPESFVITPDSIRSYQIAEMSADKLVVGTIDASLITVKNINASNINTGALTAISINGGAAFTDTLGTFYPVVIAASGGITLNSSQNYLDKITFHDTLNASSYDVSLASNGPGLLAVQPTSGTAAVGLTIASGTSSIVISANGTSGRPIISASNASSGYIYNQTLMIRTKSGVPADGDFFAPADGMLVMDTTNTKLYCRTAGAWKSVLLA